MSPGSARLISLARKGVLQADLKPAILEVPGWFPLQERGFADRFKTCCHHVSLEVAGWFLAGLQAGTELTWPAGKEGRKAPEGWAAAGAAGAGAGAGPGMLMAMTDAPMGSPTEAAGAAGSSGGWLTPAGSGTGNPDRVGTGAAGNWFSTSGLTAGIPLCRGDTHRDTCRAHQRL